MTRGRPRVQTIALCETLGVGPRSPTGPLLVTKTLAAAASRDREKQVDVEIDKSTQTVIVNVEESTKRGEVAPNNVEVENTSGCTGWPTTPLYRCIGSQVRTFGN